MVVLVEVLKESLEKYVNLLVDPWSVLKLDDEVEGVDHREML